jgi:hypothetical protein
VPVVRKLLVQSKQKRMKIHKLNNTKHSKYKYSYYQNTDTYNNPKITKQVQTTRVNDTRQMK